MELENEKVIARIKEGKSYGLTYSKLARELGVQPVTLYMFLNGTYNLSKMKKLQALCIIEKHIEQVKEQLRIIDHKGLCLKWTH